MTLPCANDVHTTEVEDNHAIWLQKPLIRRIYHDFYDLIEVALRKDVDGRVVELGAGFGQLKQRIPNCLATDIFANPWIDQVENIYHLSFDNGSLSNIVMLDVFHHLQYPGDALAECARVIAPGGRIVILEPDMGLLGLFVYGLFHHEPLGREQPIEWQRTAPALASCPADNPVDAYYAAQANAHRVFVKQQYLGYRKQWRPVSVTRMACLSYVASGGFRGRQLYPQCAYPVLKMLDRLLDTLPRLWSTRLLVVLERKKVD